MGNEGANRLDQHVDALVPNERADVADAERPLRAIPRSAEQRDEAQVGHADLGRVDAEPLELRRERSGRRHEQIDLIEHLSRLRQPFRNVLLGHWHDGGATCRSREPGGNNG